MIKKASNINSKIEELCERFSGDMLKMDGYDDCIIGVVERFGQPPILCYSTDKVLKKMMKDGMSELEAMEFFDYNQIGAWMGKTTPCFLTET